MKLPDKKYNKIIASVGLFFITFAFVFSSFFLLTPKPKKADAIVGCIALIIAKLTGFSFGGTVPVDPQATDWKEYCFDPLVRLAATLITHQIAQSMIAWIQGGFHGSPGFVTDFSSILRNTADQVIGADLKSGPLSFLCSPFKLQIQISVLQAQMKQNLSCSLTQVVQNVNNFLSGDFGAGGWQGWFVLTQQPQSNMFGETLLARLELQSAVENANNKQNQQLSWGNGFFSTKDPNCVKDVQNAGDPNYTGDIPDGTPDDESDCPNVTPGNVVQTQLNNVLPTGLKQLELADSIDEIIDTALYALLNDLLQGSGGLAGYHLSSNITPPPTIDLLPLPTDGGGGGPKPNIDPEDHDYPPPDDLNEKPGKPVLVTQNGVFFEPKDGDSRKDFQLPVDAGTYYKESVIDFDVFIPQISGPVYNGVVVDMRRYFAAWINNKNDRTLLDTFDGTLGKDANWKPNANYHVKMDYNAEQGTATIFVTNTDTGEAMRSITKTTVNRNITNKHGGLFVGFGLQTTLEQGGYTPPIGWKFSNLNVQLR